MQRIGRRNLGSRGLRLAVLTIGLAGVAAAPVPAQELLWVSQFGSLDYDDNVEGALAVDGQGSVYVGGATYGTLPGQTPLGSYDAYVRKLTAGGAESWTWQFGSYSSDRVSGVATDAAGNAYAVGASGPLPGQPWLGHSDAFVVKLGPEGQVLWTRAFGTPGVDGAQGVTTDADLNVYVVGHAVGALPGQTHRGSRDAFIRKYDPSGGELWTRQFGTVSYDLAWAVTVAGDHVYLSGYTGGSFPGHASAGGWEAFIAKYDLSGNEIWLTQFGTAHHDEGRAVAVDPAGLVHIIVQSYGTSRLLTYDPQGQLLATRQTDHGHVYDLAADSEGNLFIFGDGSYQSYLSAWTAAVEPIWGHTIGATGGSTWGRAVAVDPASGDILVAGWTYGQFPGDPSPPGDRDVFVAKVARPEANAPPVVGALSVVPSVVETGMPVAASADFTDANALDVHTATWHWGDGTTSPGEVQASGGVGTAGGGHTYTTAGVFEVRLEVEDGHGAVGTGTFQYVVVFDTDVGFVTGAGIIDSPAGAYTLDPDLEGRAVFGFLCRYQPNASAPTGEALFRLQGAGLAFRSTAYEWLVLDAVHAKFQGEGTLGGLDGFSFMVTATDGDAGTGGGSDSFRIKIWESATGLVVYDNQPGEDDASNAGTELRGGSIAIHSAG